MSSLIGVGLYSVPEASSLVGIPARKIRRWLNGYEDGGRKKQPPVWESPTISEVSDTISFQDLLEVRFVDAFRRHGVSLPAIRVASEHAREYFQQPYPFTCKRFQTDGRSIFASVREETGDDTLIDLVKKQRVFKDIIKPSLYTGIEYDQDDNALRWYPVQNSKKIVLDPERAFGKPIVASEGVTTEVLYQSWMVEDKNTKFVARLYDVSANDVEAAVKFEQRIVSGAQVLH